MKGKKGIENKEASYTYTLPTYIHNIHRRMTLKYTDSLCG